MLFIINAVFLIHKKHEVGALENVITIVKKAKLSLVKIESRPSKVAVFIRTLHAFNF